MTQWTKDELDRIGSSDEIEIAALRPDGAQRRPVTIWVARHGDDLYVRSVNGNSGAWYRGTQVTHRGRIRYGGVQKDVTFVDAAADVDDELDAAYRDKYRRYSSNIVNSILTPGARATTVKLVPL